MRPSYSSASISTTERSACYSQRFFAFQKTGDSDIGAQVNIGAGTITCNYDGRKKHKTTVGERAFVGSNSTLVAPVEVGVNAYVAAGSSVTEDVPPESLAIARGKQVNKEGWVKTRKKK